MFRSPIHVEEPPPQGNLWTQQLSPCALCYLLNIEARLEMVGGLKPGDLPILTLKASAALLILLQRSKMIAY